MQSILASKGLTLSRVSQQTRIIYGQASPYFIPHNLYYDLGLETFSPSIYQMFALSRISGYRFNDWLRVFGFDLENIPRLQAQLPSKRTILLDSSLEDPESWVPWLHNKAGNLPAPPTAPLSQLLDSGDRKRLRAVSDCDHGRFLYVKIGQQDALAFPDLLPGSIARVNPQLAGDLDSVPYGTISSQLFLIEHGRGRYCCRLGVIAPNRVRLVSTGLDYPQIELELPTEARVRGVLDLEIRFLVEVEKPDTPKAFAKSFASEVLVPGAKLGYQLRARRLTRALSFREASAASRQIADQLRDGQYFISPSSLSDYEARDEAPRHVQKIITLCVLYALDFATLVTTAGMVQEYAGRESIPEPLARPVEAGFADDDSEKGKADQPGFLEQQLAQYREVPFFLRGSLGVLSGLAVPSLRDFFWIGGERDALHPYLSNAVLAMVNRRKKKPRCDRSLPAWQQPLYIIRLRDGRYLSGCFGVEEGNLVIHSSSQQLHHTKTLRHPEDGEVVGQIVAVLRKLA